MSETEPKITDEQREICISDILRIVQLPQRIPDRDARQVFRSLSDEKLGKLHRDLLDVEARAKELNIPNPIQIVEASPIIHELRNQGIAALTRLKEDLRLLQNERESDDRPSQPPPREERSSIPQTAVGAAPKPAS